MANRSNHINAAKAAFIALLLCLSTASHADGVKCKKRKYDPQAPATLLGDYIIVGRIPNSNAIYSGKLSIDGGKTAYVLKRTVKGVTTTGKAWLENCAADGANPSKGELVLEYEYNKKNGSLHGFCYLTNDLQNSMPLSCYTDTTDAKYEQSGLEAAFPDID